MHEKMEHPTPQLVDQRIPFPNEAERGIEKSANVQALHAMVEGQLDFMEKEQWKDIDKTTGFYGEHE